jgi:hypothetical protein
MIMIGVVLFAALMYTFTKGARQGGGNISRKQAEIVAMDIISFSEAVERGTQRVLAHECGENDISFYLPGNDALADFAHTPEAPDKCKVFHPDGGAIGYLAPSPDSGASAWMFSGANSIPGIGTSLNDLIIWLPYINSGVCNAINAKLGIGDTPPEDADAAAYTPFTGDFSGSDAISDGAALDRRNTGCFKGGTVTGGAENGGYHFYHVIYAR